MGSDCFLFDDELSNHGVIVAMSKRRLSDIEQDVSHYSPGIISGPGELKIFDICFQKHKKQQH